MFLFRILSQSLYLSMSPNFDSTHKTLRKCSISLLMDVIASRTCTCFLVAKMKLTVSICTCSLLWRKTKRELKKKNAELQSKVENLEKKCAVLEVSKSGTLFIWILGIFKQKKNKREEKVIVWNTIIVTSLDIKVFNLLYFLVIFSEDVMHYSWNVPAAVVVWFGV